MRRIGIVHFTAPPRIGGIESLLALQCEVLASYGCAVSVVTAAGRVSGAATAHIPLLHPSHRRVLAARTSLDGSLPAPSHPLVEEIVAAVRPHLELLDECWVHNAFTMYLNPFLSVALHCLARDCPRVRWVAWCEDLSAASRYWPRLTPAEMAWVTPEPEIELVTISTARRDELGRFFDIPKDSIRVIPPPLDICEWLGLGSETRGIINDDKVLEREPVVLVPEKLLPHKNLSIAVSLAGELRSRGLSPLVLISGAHSPHDGAASAATLASLKASITHAGLEAEVRLLAHGRGRAVSRRTIRELMLLCDLVLLPSSEEGYGMPILEAAALRAPLLCSDIPAFREAGGCAAQYFRLDATLAEIAGLVRSMCMAQPNPSRRSAVLSRRRFEREVAALLVRESKGVPATPRAPACP